METFAGAGHMLPLECSARVAEEILQLCADIDQASA
jgi:hypothetical protein